METETWRDRHTVPNPYLTGPNVYRSCGSFIGDDRPPRPRKDGTPNGRSGGVPGKDTSGLGGSVRSIRPVAFTTRVAPCSGTQGPRNVRGTGSHTSRLWGSSTRVSWVCRAPSSFVPVQVRGGYDPPLRPTTLLGRPEEWVWVRVPVPDHRVLPDFRLDLTPTLSLPPGLQRWVLCHGVTLQSPRTWVARGASRSVGSSGSLRTSSCPEMPQGSRGSRGPVQWRK